MVFHSLFARMVVGWVEPGSRRGQRAIERYPTTRREIVPKKIGSERNEGKAFVEPKIPALSSGGNVWVLTTLSIPWGGCLKERIARPTSLGIFSGKNGTRCVFLAAGATIFIRLHSDTPKISCILLLEIVLCVTTRCSPAFLPPFASNRHALCRGPYPL